ncbi:MAG: glycosyltransferase [Thermoanaerobaculia bacterium]|nr:glycosyltransferase [Thermoanaerobaculia bacterium]
MRAGVHLQSLRPGRIGGLETYVDRLLDGLLDLDPSVELVLFCADYNRPALRDRAGVTKVELTPHGFASLDAAALAEYRLDVWFCPLLTLEPESPGLPAVVTIPDLQHEAHPEFFTDELLRWRREHYARSVAAAERIVTFSEFSRRQIVARLGADPAQVHVTPLAAGPQFVAGAGDAGAATVRERYRLPERYLFYPANNWPHKNHRGLFTALALFREHDLEVPSLVLTGAEVEGAPPLDAAVAACGLEGDVVRLGHVPGEDLPALYDGATALVYPSLFEGFGMPLIEAMQCGCPVVCSRATSLPEVGGEAAVYFDPRRPEDIFARLREVLACGEQERRGRVESGRRQAARCSWTATAAATLELLLRSARGRPRFAATRAPRRSPVISIVTPSFEQAQYLERTLCSVLEQDYPHVEHLVLDGGSEDGSVEILERYRRAYPDRLDFVSEPDRGQADAVNRGLDRSRGDIVGWLNSDDTLAPGALAAVAEAFAERAEADVVYGRARYVGADDEDLGPYPVRTSFDWEALAHDCYLCQPAVFLSRRVVDEGYRLDESLECSHDYDLWIRLGRSFGVSFLDRHLANSRMYPGNKTQRLRERVFDETFAIVKRHYGYLPASWSLGRAHHRCDGGDFLLDPRPVSRRARLLARWQLLRHNGPRRADRYRARLTRDLWRLSSRATGGRTQRLAAKAGAFRSSDPRATARLGASRLEADGWAPRRVRIDGHAEHDARSLEIEIFVPLDYLRSPFSFVLSVGGRRFAPRRFAPAAGGGARRGTASRRHALSFGLEPPLPAGDYRIEVEASDYFVPHAVEGNLDFRPLSWRLERLTLRP